MSSNCRGYIGQHSIVRTGSIMIYPAITKWRTHKCSTTKWSNEAFKKWITQEQSSITKEAQKLQTSEDNFEYPSQLLRKMENTTRCSIATNSTVTVLPSFVAHNKGATITNNNK